LIIFGLGRLYLPQLTNTQLEHIVVVSWRLKMKGNELPLVDGCNLNGWKGSS